MNLPPQPLEADLDGRLARGIAAIEREGSLSAYLNYREPGGLPDERDQAAAWLARRVPHARGERLVICPGTQNALFDFLSVQTEPGDVVLCETLTYPGLKAAAALCGVRLVGVATDAAGILPDALEAACREHAPKALYLIPTIHNPTTVTMPPARRREIAEAIRAHRSHAVRGRRLRRARAGRGPARDADPRADLSRGQPVEMHRAGPARVVPADARGAMPRTRSSARCARACRCRSRSPLRW